MSSVFKSGVRRWEALEDRPYVLETAMVDCNATEDEEPAEAGPSPEEIAQQIIAEAQERAHLVIAAAQREATRIEQEARARGAAEGEAAAAARWAEQYHALEQEAHRINQEREAMLAEAEPELARLSVEIARKILKQEITQNPEAVVTVVRAAMHRIKDREVRIAVNPKDLEIIRANREGLLAITDGVTEVEIVSDRRVGQGGCVIETPGGSLDARLETQLSHIEDLLEQACAEGHVSNPD